MHLAFALPEPTETGGGGGADYIEGLVQGLREYGHHVQLLTSPEPTFAPGAVPIIDGMQLPQLHHRLDQLVQADAVALIHHVSAAAKRDASDRERVRAIEREMLPQLRRVIATSEPVAQRLHDLFGITAATLTPGARDLPVSTPDPDDPVVLAVGVLTRRKGHDRLLHAMARLTDLKWRLIIAGSSNRDPAYPTELATLIEQLDLHDRATLIADPTPDALAATWRHATVFALATQWEGYPSAAAEALRRGIPVVITNTGGADQFIPLEAGAVCPLDDMPTFGKCLRRLLFDTTLLADMTAAARTAGRDLPSWAAQAAAFVAILEGSA